MDLDSSQEIQVSHEFPHKQGRGAGPRVAFRYNHPVITVFKHLPTMIVNPRTPNIYLKHIHSLHTLQKNKIRNK